MGVHQKNYVLKLKKKQICIFEICGKNNADATFIDNLRKTYPKIKFQAVSSNFILGTSHLKKILSLSINAEKNNALLSNKIETDILMRFALTLQISNAIDSAGIKHSVNFILITIGNKIFPDSLNHEISLISSDLLLKNNSIFIKKQFNISKKHIDSVYSKTPLEDILVEKASILF